MKKQEIIITTIIVLGLLVGFIFILKDKNPPQTPSESSGNNKDLYTIMEQEIASIGINNTSLDTNIAFLDSLCEVKPLNTICGKSAKLMVYIPQEACSSCFREELENLKTVIANFGDSNVIEICSGKNFRKALAFKNSNNISCNMFFTNAISFNGKQVTTFMYGVLDPDFKIHDVFFPMNSYPEFSKMYIKAINDRYFKKDQVKPKLAS